MKNTSTELTPNAKRVKEHRQRKKDGSNIYKLTLKPEQLDKARAISTRNEDKTPEELLHLILESTFARLDLLRHESSRLKELGAGQEIFEQYCQNEIKRLLPLSAEQFLSGER